MCRWYATDHEFDIYGIQVLTVIYEPESTKPHSGTGRAAEPTSRVDTDQ
jgi:hypothetical protein